MLEVREIRDGHTAQAAEAMLVLRPRWERTEELVEFIDNNLRPQGYRVVGAFEPTSRNALSIIGFRELWTTAWGHCLYVDDLSTVTAARGRGYADTLVRWAIAEAKHLDCEALHLDSGVTSDRAPAHRLYMRHHLQISAHHFSLQI